MEKPRIMIVEDDALVALGIKHSLEGMGYIVTSLLYSSDTAIERAVQDHPDVILMDIKLRGKVDGIEVAKRIRSHMDIPIIFLTAYADDERLNRAKLTLPLGYILKPFKDSELKISIEVALYTAKVDAERRKAEEQLRQSEEKYRDLIENINDVIYTIDKNGIVKYISPAIEQHLGYTPSSIIGHSFTEFCYQEDLPRIKKDFQKVLSGSVISDKYRFLVKSGEIHWIHASSRPIIVNNSVYEVNGVFIDVTEHERLQGELIKIQKLESIGTLAGGIAHDFNNILTGILGNISLARYTSHEEETAKMLMDAEQAAMRAKELTQQLLTFAKGGEPIKKTSFVRGLIKTSSGFALRCSNVKCEYSIPEELWPVEIDENQVGQVINNMIVNAVQAMPKGGIIRISAENFVVTAKHALPLQDGDYIRITIKDEGVGIPPNYMQKIFDPYFTTKQKGSGLGLTICYSIIKKHGGHISVDSDIGRGATFSIYLPARPREMEREREDDEKGLVYGSGRILLMDDEETVRNIASKMLKLLGYEVETANDGSEAIRLYKQEMESDNPFDIVIMDLTIPGGVGGKEAVGRLLEIDRRAKVIASSGYSNDPIMAGFQGHGFSGVILKPYDIKELSEVISKVKSISLSNGLIQILIES